MNKKGDVLDILSLIIIVFIICFGFFVISFSIPYITNGLSNAGLNNTEQGTNAINVLYDFGTNTIQKGVLWLFIGLCIGTLISAFYSDTHPVWLFLYIAFLIIAVILAGYLANAYETATNLDVFGGWQQITLTTIMQHSVIVFISVAILSWIIMFVKFVSGNGGTRF